MCRYCGTTNRYTVLVCAGGSNGIRAIRSTYDLPYVYSRYKLGCGGGFTRIHRQSSCYTVCTIYYTKVVLPLSFSLSPQSQYRKKIYNTLTLSLLGLVYTSAWDSTMRKIHDSLATFKSGLGSLKTKTSEGSFSWKVVRGFLPFEVIKHMVESHTIA